MASLPKTIIIVLGVFLLFSIPFIIWKATQGTAKDEKGGYVAVDSSALETEARFLAIAKTNDMAKSIPVLNYHLITKDPIADDPYSISYDHFKENMFALKKEGYQTITLHDLYLFLRGEKTVPEKSFVLTFDDGAKVTYYNGDAILNALHYTATMFVITGTLEPNGLNGKGKSYYLTEKELTAMQQTGRWELASHTHMSHSRIPTGPNGELGPALTNKMWNAQEHRLETDEEYLARVTHDLQTSKTFLETHFHTPILGFAFPFGALDEEASNYPAANTLLSTLATRLFLMSFIQFRPAKNIAYRANTNDQKKESYLVIRIPADTLPAADLLQELSASHATALPYTETYANDKKWVPASRALTVHFTADSLLLAKDPNNGIFSAQIAYLDGSSLWQNYHYSIRLYNAKTPIELLARFKDPLAYISCKYDTTLVKIIQTANDIPRTIQTVPINLPITDGTTLSIDVNDHTIRCFINEQEVARTDIPTLPPYGGVGIKTDDARLEPLAITNIAITSH